MTKIQGSGTVLKKCGCQTKRTCPHGWTLRYWADGKQREKTFRDTPGKPGSGKGLAEDFALKLAVGKREGDLSFADKTKAAISFVEYCEQWISTRRAKATRVGYMSTLNSVRAELGTKTVAQVASDREGAQRLIDGALGSYAKRVRILLVSPCNEALKAGRITSHRLRGLRVEEPSARAEFVFADRSQLEIMATELGGVGLLVWAGRLAGLRIAR